MKYVDKTLLVITVAILFVCWTFIWVVTESFH